jgi:hypothetical protein
MASRRPLNRKTLFNAAGALAGLIVFVLGILLVTRLVAFDPDLPPLSVAISTDATISARSIAPDVPSSGKQIEALGYRYVLSYAFFDEDHIMQGGDVEVSAIYYYAHPEGSMVKAWYFSGRSNVSVLDDPAGLAASGSRWGQLFGGILLVVGGISAVTLGNRAAIAFRGHGWL